MVKERFAPTTEVMTYNEDKYIILLRFGPSGWTPEVVQSD